MTMTAPGTEWTAPNVRKSFCDYFISKYGHKYWHSSSTIPLNDPTLLFANAGMNQYKPIFLGTVDPNSELAHLRRATNSQKCIRAGGKHNDLDDVGKDLYHHTFFEMLGNWSFGDFFKLEAIEMAWELLTEVYKLDPSRLYVSYFEGDENCPVDTEARDIWINVIGLDPSRVLPFGDDNFWKMGDQGPCGPCSEIHYDRIGGRDAAHLVNQDDPDVLEIWNLVFIQYNSEANGKLQPLPKKHVDTGMGLERLVSCLQDVKSNYDTDLFQPYFDAIHDKTGTRAYQGKLGDEDVDNIDMAYRVVADHVRTLTIALSDGGVPGATGRSYVLRRILRRAVRFCVEKLNAPQGVLGSLVPLVVASLGDSFPELKTDPQGVIDIINDEEDQFLKTLKRGQKVFSAAAEKALAVNKVIPGLVAFRLYDTYGFPTDLTELMAEEMGLTVDQQAYEVAKEEARLASQGGKGSRETKITLDVHKIAELKTMGVPLTDASPKYNYSPDSNRKYSFPNVDGTILKLVNQNQEFVDEIVGDGVAVGVVLDRTNFYATQGGQECDKGFLSIGDSEVSVTACDLYGGYVLHTGTVSGALKVGNTVTCSIDVLRRRPIMCNHTGTHIINWALRDVLKTECQQKGSLVTDEYLRFDFSSKSALTLDQISKVEAGSVAAIAAKREIYTEERPLDEAIDIDGLRAVFGETYPNPVRVVSVGADVGELVEGTSELTPIETSVEFCGGTHVRNSGDIGEFVVVKEEAVAKGIRRIVAYTYSAAVEAMKLGEALSKDVDLLGGLEMAVLKPEVNRITGELTEAVISYALKAKLLNKLKEHKVAVVEYEKELKKKRLAVALDKVKELLKEKPEDKLYVHRIDVEDDGRAIDSALKQFIKLNKTASVFLCSKDQSSGKVAYGCVVPSDVAKSTLKASDWVAEIRKTVGGRGGGKPTSAQGTTENGDIDEMIALANSFATAKL